MRKKIIAVDFDNTLFKTDYPNIKEPIKNVIDYCKTQQELGNILILWTCRNDMLLLDAVRECEKYGLTFDYVNRNAEEVMQVYKYKDNRKIYADIYIDDKAFRPEEVENAQ